MQQQGYGLRRSPFSLRLITISDSFADIRPNLMPLFSLFFALFIVGITWLGPLISGILEELVPTAKALPWRPWAILIAAAPLLLMIPIGLLFGKTLRIDPIGVTQRYLFRTTRLTWRQVRDLGVSYAGLGCGRLYFSDERLQTNGSGRKLLSGGCCSILLRPRDLKMAGRMLAACRSYTRVRPFLCTEEERLVGKVSLR